MIMQLVSEAFNNAPLCVYTDSTLQSLTFESRHAGAVVVVEAVLAQAPVGAGGLRAFVDVAGAGGARVAGDT